MNENLVQKTELFVKNRNHVIQGLGHWYSENLCLTAAYMFTEKNVEADAEALKEAKSILKKNSNVFSELRSYAEVPLIAKMALSGDPAAYLEDVKETYHQLRKHKLSASAYLVLTSMFIVDQKLGDRAEELAEKTAELYRAMRKEHPLLTSYEDVSMAALLVCSNRSIEDIVSDMENCFRSLKKEFRLDHNSLQTLCEVLSTDELSSTVKCAKVLEYRDAMKLAGKKFNGTGTVPTLGMFLNMPISADQIAAEVKEVDNFLKKQKGFSMWHVNTDIRLMFSGMLVAESYSDVRIAAEASVQSTLAATIATEVAITTAIILCTIAASSAARAAAN